jgi:uncharacterized protein (TIGR02118 family)
MVKLVFIIRRREDLGTEEFHKYWLEKHGPLVRSFADAIRARKYVQSHTVRPDFNAMLAQARAMGEAYDGITEVWWESIEDMMAGLDTVEGRKANRALAEDEAKFIDHKRSFIFMTEEHTIFDL